MPITFNGSNITTYTFNGSSVISVTFNSSKVFPSGITGLTLVQSTIFTNASNILTGPSTTAAGSGITDTPLLRFTATNMAVPVKIPVQYVTSSGEWEDTETSETVPFSTNNIRYSIQTRHYDTDNFTEHSRGSAFNGTIITLPFDSYASIRLVFEPSVRSDIYGPLLNISYNIRLGQAYT